VLLPVAAALGVVVPDGVEGPLADTLRLPVCVGLMLRLPVTDGVWDGVTAWLPD